MAGYGRRLRKPAEIRSVENLHFSLETLQDEKSLTLAVWTTKALLLKGSKTLGEWIDRLLMMASGPQARLILTFL